MAEIKGSEIVPGSRIIEIGQQFTVESVQPDDPEHDRYRFQPPEVIADAILVRTTTPGVSLHLYKSRSYQTW